MVKDELVFFFFFFFFFLRDSKMDTPLLLVDLFAPDDVDRFRAKFNSKNAFRVFRIVRRISEAVVISVLRWS